MTEQQYIDIFAELATQHKEISHTESEKAFFYIEDADDLNEFDKALRNVTKEVIMLLVANDGEFNDNETNNYTDEPNGQMYILMRKLSNKSIREINNQTKQIALQILARLRLEHPRTFRLNKIPYQKVGPMNDEWYGYTIGLSFVCPFGFKVDSGTWHDK